MESNVMNMIEKVARAIKEARYNSLDENEDALGMAKAAIEAMREPTDGMLNGARDWSVAKHGRGVGNVDATQCFQSMIDAALKE